MEKKRYLQKGETFPFQQKTPVEKNEKFWPSGEFPELVPRTRKTGSNPLNKNHPTASPTSEWGGAVLRQGEKKGDIL